MRESLEGWMNLTSERGDTVLNVWRQRQSHMARKPRRKVKPALVEQQVSSLVEAFFLDQKGHDATQFRVG